MAKRFHDTEIWHEDWFLEMPKEYILFWIFIKDNCDHAGIWRPNRRRFEKLIEVKIELETAFKFFNVGRTRVAILPNGRWFIISFIPFQYGRILNVDNRMHKSILRILEENEVNLGSIRPLIEVKHSPMIRGLKNKDKNKDKDSSKEEKDKQKKQYAFNILIKDTVYIKDLSSFYPNVPIKKELRKMQPWVWANPNRLKSNWRRFMVNWLNDAVEKYPAGAHGRKVIERLTREDEQNRWPEPPAVFRELIKKIGK